jgi:cytochrome c-type biogenesis protein CcmH/NrfG
MTRGSARADRQPLDQGKSPGGLLSSGLVDPAASWQDFLMRFAIIVLAALWIYSPVYHPFFPADWLWDDDQLLTANATVQSTTLSALWKLWFNPDGADYFPLSYTALWLQWPFFKMWPTGYHLTTVVLHIVGSLLLWRLLAVMKLPGAWLAAVLFAVHPVCVESVTWVSELKNTVSLPLFLLSAISFVKFDDAGESSPTASRHYVLSLVFFLLAMLAKTSVVAMPVVLLLYVWWKRGTVTVRDLVRTAPFFLISIVLGIVTIYYQHGRAIGQETIIVGGMDSRIATAGMLILFYLKTILWPVTLLPIYPKWEVDPPQPWQFLAWPVIAAAGWWFWKNRDTWGRHVIFGVGFFLLTVAPVLGFITISYMRITWAADHFIYLPMIGVIALIAAGVATLYERISATERPLLMSGTALVLAVLTAMSFRYAGAWVNEDALWSHTLRHNENAWQAHNRLGAKKFARGHVDDINPPTRIENRGALHHFTRSTALRPDLGETHNNLGTALSAKGRMNEAIEQFKEACRVTPHVPAIHVNLANSLAAGGRFEEAEAKYLELIQGMEKQHAEAMEKFGNPNLPIDPSIAALLNNYGVTLFKQEKKEQAIAAFRRALAINPNLKDARESLAVATGEKPMPEKPDGPAPTPAAGVAPQIPMKLPQSPTLGPLP